MRVRDMIGNIFPIGEALKKYQLEAKRSSVCSDTSTRSVIGTSISEHNKFLFKPYQCYCYSYSCHRILPLLTLIMDGLAISIFISICFSFAPFQTVRT